MFDPISQEGRQLMYAFTEGLSGGCDPSCQVLPLLLSLEVNWGVGGRWGSVRGRQGWGGWLRKGGQVVPLLSLVICGLQQNLLHQYRCFGFLSGPTRQPFTGCLFCWLLLYCNGSCMLPGLAHYPHLGFSLFLCVSGQGFGHTKNAMPHEGMRLNASANIIPNPKASCTTITTSASHSCFC